MATWAKQQDEWPQAFLLAVGLPRTWRDELDAADARLRNGGKPVPEAWAAARANEEAALLWHRGRADEADANWAKQAETVPVLFNRGLAALFLGRPIEARTWLRGPASSCRKRGHGAAYGRPLPRGYGGDAGLTRDQVPFIAC